ncbi:MAG: nucleotidyltransferase, partial [Bacteroidales bacterium]
MKPTLFVLAAGMGSRYGGLKQLDGLGPNGETIMDYSIYDAVRAGFGKVVFVIRHSFENDFRTKIINKYENVIPVELVFQELDYLPEGFTLNPERVKPWGTNHATLMGKDVIKEPFAVINADDFYGRESFSILADSLKEMGGKKDEYCMIGYRVGNTLSESGSVARGICEVNSESYLTTVVERTHIERIDGIVKYKDEAGEFVSINDNTPVSMNMWGFTPDYFDYSEKFFIEFLKENESNIKAEFFIPLVVNTLIESETIKLKVLDTPSMWFGV